MPESIVSYLETIRANSNSRRAKPNSVESEAEFIGFAPCKKGTESNFQIALCPRFSRVEVNFLQYGHFPSTVDCLKKFQRRNQGKRDQEAAGRLSHCQPLSRRNRRGEGSRIFDRGF